MRAGLVVPVDRDATTRHVVPMLTPEQANALVQGFFPANLGVTLATVRCVQEIEYAART